MRSALIRCLVVLLALALVANNAHSVAHPILAAQPVAHPHHNHADASRPHPHWQDKGLGCCRDCLGCAAAFTLSRISLSVLPIVYDTAIRYPTQAFRLRGRVLLPEPKPPRPTALI
jgi:hypothetical protein